MRRRSLALIVALAAACGGSETERPATVERFGIRVGGADYGEELHLFTWSDYLDPELVAEFERTYGVTANAETVAAKLGGRSRLISMDEGSVELVQPTGAGAAQDALDHGGPGAFRLSLATTNIDQAHAYLTGNGVRVSAIEPRDDGRQAFLIDPRDAHGVALEIVA